MRQEKERSEEIVKRFCYRGHKIMTVVVVCLIGFSIARIVGGNYTLALIDLVLAALIGATMMEEAKNE